MPFPSTVESWGRVRRGPPSRVVPLFWRTDRPFTRGAAPFLAYGLGRSYGDVCLNDGGTLLATRGLDRFISLDAEAGLLRCEAGVSLAEILAVVVPHGFYLPVVPGTREVTVGGAIANDVHGKNHHRAGTFGAHVAELELLRADGTVTTCSPTVEPERFAATVGGLGLTGVILSAAIRLHRLPAPGVEHLVARATPLWSLDDYFTRAEDADAASEFTVAWIDGLATGARAGRGLLLAGDWAQAPAKARRRRGPLPVPFDLPFSPVRRPVVRAFNRLYELAQRRRAAGLVHHEPFFFPLDALARWNRLYGRRGFFQLQCAVPPDAAPAAFRALLAAAARSGEVTPLVVLKRFGPAVSPGLLSFPREGATLTLDFPNRGEPTLRLFSELHAIVADHGGRIYAAKDALMPAAQFRAQHAGVLERFVAQVDPAFSSSLWRRVTA
jgi:FAD/FMN-containing dehydrogenase